MSPHTHASQKQNKRSFGGQNYWGFKVKGKPLRVKLMNSLRRHGINWGVYSNPLSAWLLLGIKD